MQPSRRVRGCQRAASASPPRPIMGGRSRVHPESSPAEGTPMRKPLLLTVILVAGVAFANREARLSAPLQAQAGGNVIVNPNTYQDLRWRSVGPHRGGRSTAAAGVRTQPNVFYMGATGGGVWKTENYGITWTPISDGQIATGSIGAIDVSDSNPNVIYVGTGSEAIRSHVILGRGVYKSTDAGRTWQFSGL